MLKGGFVKSRKRMEEERKKGTPKREVESKV